MQGIFNENLRFMFQTSYNALVSVCLIVSKECMEIALNINCWRCCCLRKLMFTSPRQCVIEEKEKFGIHSLKCNDLV